MLREVERRLGERGGRLLIVETSSRESYVGTRRFYETRGYHEAARVRSFYAPLDDRVVYTKRLTPVGARATTVHAPPPH
jgi:ribosomal protein S18 acetylase RimI-like enzyme